MFFSWSEKKGKNMVNLQYVWIRNYESVRTIASHRHSCYEIVCYLKGSGTGEYGDETYSYSEGTFLLVSPETLHEETHAELTSMISVGFTVENLAIPAPQSCVVKDAVPILFDYIQKFRHEFKKKRPYYKQSIENLIELILTEILYATTESLPECESSGIDYAISYINEYYMTDLDLSQISRSAGYCDDWFRALFKKKTGMAPKAYILNVRLAAAKKMLADPSIELTSIAERCGYEYYSQFSLFFKKKTCLSPLEYRQRMLVAPKDTN